MANQYKHQTLEIWAFLSASLRQFKCGAQCPVNKRNIQCMFGFACGELGIKMCIAGGFGLSLSCSNLDVSRSQGE